MSGFLLLIIDTYGEAGAVFLLSIALALELLIVWLLFGPSRPER